MVKAYADYGQAALLAGTELRSRSEAARHLPEKAAFEEAIAPGLQKLVVLAEDYPELKADDNFRKLQSELTEVEDYLEYARRFYNGAVRIFNTRVQSFPYLLIAAPLGFTAAEFFAVDDAQERSAPRVETHQVWMRQVKPHPPGRIALLLAGVLYLASAVVQEQILSFYSDISIAADAAISLRESVTVLAEDNIIRRGI